MKRYYDITLFNEKGGSMSFWADSFSIDKNGVLRVQSEECENVTIQIEPNETLSMRSIEVREGCDDMRDYYERARCD